MDKIVFTPEGNEEPVELYVLDQTVLRGTTYILVTESEEGDGNALILKDTAPEGADESVYEIVDEDTELDAVSDLFRVALDDMDIGLEP
jgi:hypothetical protein